MRHTHPRELRLYRTPTGRVPFAEWYDTIQDLTLQGGIDKRLERVANGNFGDCRSVGAGVLNYASTSDQAIVSILVKWITQSFCSSVQEISRRRRETLNGQRTIGYNTRRHNDGKTNDMARISN